MSALKKSSPVSGFDVDRLGTLLASIADLEKQAKAIKARIKDQVAVKLEGALFEATVIRSDRLTVDPDLVKDLLGERFGEVLKSTEVVTVKVVSRKA